MGSNLVTLAEYKAYAGITSTNQDTQISSVIPKVSQLIKSICKRTFIDYVDEDKVEIKTGGSNYLMLDEGPVISIVSVEYSEDFGATYTPLVEYTDYVLDEEVDGLCTLQYNARNMPLSWPRRINGYKITYKAGYVDLPEDLKVACLDLVTYYLKNDSAVHSNRTMGSNTVQIEYVTKSTLPSHISRVLDLYVYNFS